MVKRLNVEIPREQHEALRREASVRGITISGVLRDLIASLNQTGKGRGRRGRSDDPLYRMAGAFDGPVNLAEKHDAFLYGKRRA